MCTMTDLVLHDKQYHKELISLELPLLVIWKTSEPSLPLKPSVLPSILVTQCCMSSIEPAFSRFIPTRSSASAPLSVCFPYILSFTE